MKNRFYLILSCGCVATFFLYWIIVFILAMPSNYPKKVITSRLPRFKNIFGSTWKLFTPPNNFNDRLYFITRDINSQGKADTIEVLENISLQKQQKAPFNQKENVIDHLVNNNVSNVKITVRSSKKNTIENQLATKDSLKASTIIDAFVNNPNAIAYLSTLKNYGMVVLKQNKVDTTGKEFKMVITEKKIRPFNQMADTNFVETEIIFFETPYQPFIK